MKIGRRERCQMKKIKKPFAIFVAALVCAFSVVLTPIKTSHAAQYEQAAETKTCDGLSYFCTALDSAVDFITGFYETVVVQFLVVEPELFTSNRPGSAGYALHNAWEIFRNLANLVLVIALLLIIISQITGVGISNYGIKKGLPKLIVAVLAVNFSYIFCQACIDLANIVGAGIGDFFEGLLDQATPPGVTLDHNGTWLTSIFLGLGAFAFVKYKALTVKIFIGILLLILICIVAIIVLYVILALRQSLCILLVVISPIAIVSYMVPGGKKLFDLWKNALKSVLMAYPICSAIVYGGAFAGAVLYSSWATSGGGSEVLNCLGFLIISTIPYFFIPSAVMKGLSVTESLAHNIRNFASKNSRSIFENSRLIQTQRLKDQRLREINRSGQYLDRNGNLQKRMGFGRGKFIPKKIQDPTSGPFKTQRKKLIDVTNSAMSSAAGALNTLQGTKLNQSIVKWNQGRAAMHMRSAATAAAAMRRHNKYRVMKDYDNKGNLVAAFGKDGKYKTPGVYYVKNSSGVWVAKTALGFRDKLDYMYHTHIGLRFQNASRFNEQYIQSAQDTMTGIEKRAYSDMKRDTLGEGYENKAADLKARIVSGDKNKAVVALSSLLDEGQAGRDELEAMIDSMAGSIGSDSYKQIEEFLSEISEGELNKIKKKNPRLWNKIKALQKSHDNPTLREDISDIGVTMKNLDGMSAKQFGEMDASAQDAVIESLTRMVEDDAKLAPGAMKAVDSEELLTAIALAEGAINDPNVRASLSAENIARLEHIVELRTEALNKTSAATAAQDAQAIRTSPIGTLSVTDASFETQYLQGLQQVFAPSTPRGGADNFLQAMQNGDTVRMESIMQSIDRDLDQRMSQAGITDPKERALRRNSIMMKAVRTMTSGDGVAGSTGINGGLYGTGNNSVQSLVDEGRNAQKAIDKDNKKIDEYNKKASEEGRPLKTKRTATPGEAAKIETAQRYLRAREAVDLLEQRYARRMSY